MSGGAWGYLSQELQDLAEHENEGQRRINACLLVMAGIEHQLDWGVSGDTCKECAEKRVIAALYALFDDMALDASRALEILPIRSPKYQCQRCDGLDEAARENG